MTRQPEPSDPASNLARFQHQLDLEALVQAGVAQGLSEPRLRACVAGLKPIFDSLAFGEQPAYEQLDQAALARLAPEIEFVARAMAQSPTADLRIAGLHVMGALDSPAFMQDLQASLESAQEWERIEAVRALGRTTQPNAHALLRSASSHPELQTRQAAASALRQFDERAKGST
ncbi:MAG TPA: HEAT repeat domain-containing protein [Herpetosiphonaceae bacterium]